MVSGIQNSQFQKQFVAFDYLIRKIRDLWLGIQNSCNHVLSNYLVFRCISNRGAGDVTAPSDFVRSVSSISTTEGEGGRLCPLKNTAPPPRIFRPSYGPAICSHDVKNMGGHIVEFSLENSNCAASPTRWVNLPNVVRALFQLRNVHKWRPAILNDFWPTYLLSTKAF